MMRPALYWLLGLPGIGKTHTARPLLASHGQTYVEADDFRIQAWGDYMAATPSAAGRSGGAALSRAYVQAICDVGAFTRFHVALAPFLLRRLRAHAGAHTGARVVIEVSSLYAHALTRDDRQVFVTVAAEVHMSRLASSLQIDSDLARQLHWTYALAELRLRRPGADTGPVDLHDTAALLERLS